MAEVLIVDDDPDIRTMLSFALGGHGFDVRQAPDGAVALLQLEERAPDLMVLDLMMPNVDGFTVLERMRDGDVARDTRVVILTCRTDGAASIRARELGADAYLVKPTDPDVLALRLRSLLEPVAAP